MATNNFEYLAELTLDTNSNIYNLFITTYNGDTVNLNVFICERKHDMRLDLVANEVYQNTRYTGTLCQLNNILNPFSIREGDVLFYTTEGEAEELLVVPEIIKQSGIEDLLSGVKSDLINVLKKRRPDANRRLYNNNRNDDILPPTVLPQTAPMSVVENDKIRIAPNLFQSPKQEPVSLEPIETSVGVIEEPQRIERILVNRYIKLINE